MKRIAFVLPGMGIGGVERSFLGLLRFAPKDEFDITLLLFSRGGELLGEVPEWVNIEYVSQTGGTESVRRGISSLLKKFRLHRIFAVAKSVYHAIGPSLVGKINGKDFDIAIAYNDGMATWYTAKSVNAARKIAFIHTDFKLAGYNPQTERSIYKEFESIYFGSELSKQHFLDLLPEYAEKSLILPSCVDAEYVRSKAAEDCQKLSDDALRIMTVGRLSHEKGMDKIPEILRLLEEDNLVVKWYIVGDGVEQDNLIARANDLGVADDMILLGAQKNPYPYMAQCDIYVQPSNYEGYCIALAEARSLGKPCVACAFSGASEQIKDGEDGFVTGMTAPELYAKCKMLAKDEYLRESFSRKISERNNESDSRFIMWWRNLLNQQSL